MSHWEKRRTYNNSTARPASCHECIAQPRSQFRHTGPQMEYSWCRVLWFGCGSVLQEREEGIKQDFAWIQPFPDILAGRELRVPVGRVVIVGGASSFGPRWVRSHSLGKCEGGGSKKFVFVASRSQCSRKQYQLNSQATSSFCFFLPGLPVMVRCKQLNIV